MMGEAGSDPAFEFSLPRPFFDDPWPREKRDAAQALWEWHLSMWTSGALEGWQPEDVELAAGAQGIRWMSSDVTRAAYEACDRHGLDRAWLAAQMRSVPWLRPGQRFETAADLGALADDLAGSHGILLASLADAAHTWQLPWVRAFSRGLFLTGRLMQFSVDVRNDRWFVPLDDLEQAEVDLSNPSEWTNSPALTRVLWKQSVRARDALAEALPLVDELDRRYARAFKTWWMGAVEVLGMIERRRYDVWSRPIELSAFQRLQVQFQSRFGRTTFRARR